MTRDYNKSRRNDSRPPFRQNSSSGRYREEQSSRPGRPRLNREIVDRAWEQGAQTQHADYRPRTSNGQGRQNNWRGNQPEYSSHQNGTGGNRPYGNRRQANYSDSPGGNRPYGNRRPANGAGGNRPYDYQQPTYDTPRNRQDNYRRNNGSTSQGYRGTQPPYEQNGYQGRAPQNRRNGERPYQQRRYDQQGAPEDRRGYRSNPSRYNNEYAPGGNGRRAPYEEHFEGDYEHFGYDNVRNHKNDSSERPQRDQRSRRNESDAPGREERHVTRLPDGRVLKGPRPVQRKDAQFWTEVANDTDELLEQIPEPSVEERANTDAAKEKKAQAKKPRAAQDKGAARGKKGAEAQHPTVPRPSQRGFKWPAQ